MSNQIEVTRKYVQDLTPAALVGDKGIQVHLEAKLCAMHGISPEASHAFYEREKDNLVKRVSESSDLRQCTSMSVFMVMAQVCGWKLSFEPGSQSDVYVIPGNVNVGTKDSPKWEKHATVVPSPYGEKKIRIETQQIKDVDNPVVVYENDHFKKRTDSLGAIVVEYEERDVKTDNDKIVGSFIRIQKPDGTFQFKTYDLNDINRWKAASAKKNKNVANALYTSNNGQIDVGFLEGKTLKHAFKLYPRVVNAPKLPETFVASVDDAARQGLDMSEFTEDVVHEEIPVVKEESEFEKVLAEESKPEPVATTQFASAGVDDDEPEF
jgi:hypothetical protein